MTRISSQPRTARAVLLSLAAVLAGAGLATVSQPVEAHGGGYGRVHARPGVVVRVGPPVGFHGGYRPWGWGPSGYVAVRPSYGPVYFDRSAAFTLVTVAGIGYLLSNGVYYRELASGGYEAVPPPVDAAAMAASVAPAGAAPASRLYVYPARGQTAEQQATDEYECHAWAVGQSGFDPSSAATGQRVRVEPTQRDDYRRANTACLEGRGYSVR